MPAKALRAVPNKPEVIDVPVVGTVCGHDPQRGILVDFPQNPLPSPVAARWTIPLDVASLEEAIREQRKAVLVFENGDPLQPIVTGLIQPTLLNAAKPKLDVQLPGALTEVKVDGDSKRLAFDAQDEIVLRCGQASITLRRNGRVVIRGAYVETRSAGVNRIKGGSVQIN